MIKRSELVDVRETRSVDAGEFEIRENGDNLTLTGYASVFNKGYDIYGGPDKGGWTEYVSEEAFDVTLRSKPDLHLLINHEGMPLARTKSGTLRLSTDLTGLQVDADLDRADPDVQRLETKMKRGDMDEMSFAFRVLGQKWEEDDTKRTLTEVSLHKGDVSVVNFGANPATSASLRSISDVFEALKDMDPDMAVAELRSAGGEDLLAEVNEALNTLTDLRRKLQPKDKQPLATVDELRKILAETQPTPARPTVPGLDS